MRINAPAHFQPTSQKGAEVSIIANGPDNSVGIHLIFIFLQSVSNKSI
jgi:hypothetical protein